MKKHILPFLLAAWPYLFSLLAFIPEERMDALLNWILQMSELLALQLATLLGSPNDYERALAIWEGVITVCGVIFSIGFFGLILAAILYPLRCKSLSALELARWDFIIKLCHIPVYVLVFLFCLLLLLAIAAPAVLMMALFGIPSLVFFDLVMMLTSSCYGFRALHMAKLEGIVDKKWATKHTIFHCIFVADVISAFLVWRRLRRVNSSEEVFPC